LAFFTASFLVRILLFVIYKTTFQHSFLMSLSLDSTKKIRFSSMYNNMKIETLVLAFFLQTLLFSVEIRGGGQISNQTGVIA